MSLSEKDIKHIASLARLELTDKEIKQYRTELGGILRYVDQLKNIRLKKFKVSKTAGTVTMSRADVIKIWPEDEREIALEQVPERKDRLVKVKRILN